jgi:serine/threonine-protein kinase HipA
VRTLKAYLDQRLVGTLSEGDDLWRFEYDPGWAGAENAFDLAPGLPRASLTHADGGTNRPVQWYFDNLLPEELLRQTIQKEAGIKGDDAFALLEYLGAESAGSLTLLPEGVALPDAGALRPLKHEALSVRIGSLPQQSLGAGSLKRMSLAGAQHKLLVVLGADNRFFEPEGATPSTHILKPSHPDSDTYPASVANEYVTMRLASAAGLPVPDVRRFYVPEPIYVVERFDRRVVTHKPAKDGIPRLDVNRLHIIDACQLLNRSRLFKHAGATLEALKRIIHATTNKVLSRTRLFRWLVFNVLVANDDCHLKNLSFYVSQEGVQVAPHYDLLATGAYHTRAFADEKARWPGVPMAIALPHAKTFAEVTRQGLLQAGLELGLAERTAVRIVDEVCQGVSVAMDAEIKAQAALHARVGAPANIYFGAETRLLLVMKNIVLAEMLPRLMR